MKKTIHKACVKGSILIPSSKSQTIRALLVATFSKGKSIVRNPLFSADISACVDICTSLGAIITTDENDNFIVDSTNVGTEKSPITLDCKNSGTSMYLATSMAASLGREITFTGDKQLKKRPVENLLNSLRDLGVKVKNSTGFPPYTIKGPIKGGKTTILCHTSQYLSSLLLGCPLAKGKCNIQVPLLYEKPYVKITETYLIEQKIKYTKHQDLQFFSFEGNQKFNNIDLTIAGDFSSASFFFGAAAITNSSITVTGLNPDDPQGDKGILRILYSMGCDIQWKGDAVTVTGPKKLKGGVFDLNSMPDALPILACVSAFSSQPVRLGNVSQARIKETDRISAMYQALRKLGANVTELHDGLSFQPVNELIGNEVSGFEDHRIIMALAIVGLGCKGDLTIDNIDAVDVTFPSFFKLLDKVIKKEN